MHFADTPQPNKALLPGIFEVQEKVMCRRRASGAQSWTWQAGATVPVPPDANHC